MLPNDFREFLQLLNSNSVRYLVIGGYAINFHGYSRNTEDLDVWVALAPGNAERIASALRQFGFTAVAPSNFREPGWVVRLGVPPMRLEVLTSISGVDFEECYARRETFEADGVTIPLIGKQDLIANKLASGRLKDLADAERLGLSGK